MGYSNFQNCCQTLQSEYQSLAERAKRSPLAVRRCPMPDCFLYRFRFGKGASSKDFESALPGGCDAPLTDSDSVSLTPVTQNDPERDALAPQPMAQSATQEDQR